VLNTAFSKELPLKFHTNPMHRFRGIRDANLVREENFSHEINQYVINSTKLIADPSYGV
jgi:hypothetical protein